MEPKYNLLSVHPCFGSYVLQEIINTKEDTL